jgi:histidine ammonia-lyase
MMSVTINGSTLTIEQIERVGRGGELVELDAVCGPAIAASQAVVLKMVEENRPVYGVTTGIGEFARIRIDQAQCEELQKRIIYSHAAGTGDPQPPDVVRGAMLARLNMLSKGYSGVRPSTVELYRQVLNRGVVPVVYEKGSVGCSGDLSPLSQLALVILGEGEAFYEGQRMPGGEALHKVGLEPLRLTYKEGLGLINGTQMMTAEAALYLCDTIRLYKHALVAYAMALDALKAVERAYDARGHAVRPYPGAIATAAALRQLFAGSGIMADMSGKVQDGYSMRCTPQIFGASIDTFHFVRRQIETELNSAIDNPLFFSDGDEYFAAGNFHGQPVAMAMDFMAIATAECASLAERHTNRMLNPTLSGLPDFLVEGKGLNSGLMVAQYTQAALCAENRIYSHPAVVDNVSVSADQEDHVNFGPVAVRKYKEMLKNTRAVIAIEMYAAAQAMDFRARGITRQGNDAKPAHPGKGTGVAYDLIRQRVSFLEDDRPLVHDIEKIVDLLSGTELIDAVEAAVGEIKLEA